MGVTASVMSVPGCCGAATIAYGERDPSLVKEFTDNLKTRYQTYGLFTWAAMRPNDVLRKAYLDNGWKVIQVWQGQYKGPQYAYLGAIDGYNMELFALVTKPALDFSAKKTA